MRVMRWPTSPDEGDDRGREAAHGAGFVHHFLEES
jgi:hypothetical protein